MKKAEVHIDNDTNKLKIFLYKDEDNLSKASAVLRGPNAYEYVEKLCKDEIKEIFEDPISHEIIVIYDNLEFSLYEVNRLLRNEELYENFKPFFVEFMKFYNKKMAQEFEFEKVSRENKYGIKKISFPSIWSIAFDSECQHEERNELKNVSSISVEYDYGVLNKSEEDTYEEEIEQTSIYYDDCTDQDIAYTTYINYSEKIFRYSKEYGIDNKLILAILTNGMKENADDPMQLKNWLLKEKVIAYNFREGKYETVIIDKNKISNLDYCIKIACMIYQSNLIALNYNTLLALQSYNMGYDAVISIVNYYCYSEGKNSDEVIEDSSDVAWMNYRNLINNGDNKYIENVLRFCGSNIKISNKKIDGHIKSLNIISKSEKDISFK